MSLTQQDLTAAAQALGCSIHAIRAVDRVESAGAGFDQQGRVKLLFEPHVFHRLTGGIYAARVHLSYPKWLPRAPSYRRDQHEVLAEARALRPLPGQLLPGATTDDAAVQSCSWGRYQVMGFHWRICGHRTIAEFEARMRRNETEHLTSFVCFIRAQPGLLKALRTLDWPEFARLYNGPGYAENQYDIRLAEAHLKSTKEHARGTS